MMNKYEKALKCIRILCLFKSDDDEDLTESDKETIQSLDTFQELVEKATPKEPIYQGDGYVDGELVFDTALCPNCNAEFEYGYGNWGDPYCPKCGQALDWVDDEDA